jgi:hypothetical protein
VWVTIKSRDVLYLDYTLREVPQASSEFLPYLAGSVTLYVVQYEARTIPSQVKVAQAPGMALPGRGVFPNNPGDWAPPHHMQYPGPRSALKR